jgi:hypothetical protein
VSQATSPEKQHARSASVRWHAHSPAHENQPCNALNCAKQVQIFLLICLNSETHSPLQGMPKALQVPKVTPVLDGWVVHTTSSSAHQAAAYACYTQCYT